MKQPSCTPQELAAQQSSLQAIQAQAQATPVSEIPMPTMLCRIKLCDGQEVYLLHHELAMLQGNYTILQTIAVTSLNQTFVSGFPAVTTPTAFTGAPPPRYDLFALKLLYYANDPQVKSLYKGYNNGNIATMYWQVTGRDRQVYSFLYDKPDRLRHGFYAEITEQGTYYNRSLYDEWSVTYDKVGNIETLNRRGAWGGCDNNGQFLFDFGTIDDLSYQYDNSRSRLTNIQDGVFGDAGLKGIRANQNAYDYDHNGNLVTDSGKGVSTFYNHLNLPRQLDVQSGSNNNGGSIQWVYDALGNKLKKISSESGNTLYHHGIEQSEGAIFVYHAEGRAALYPPEEMNASPQWRYEYSMDDHLGNVRLTFSDLNGDGYIQANPGDWSGDGNPGGVKDYSEVLQENHYYPFGMSMEGQWRMPDLVQKTNRYQFNGIERHGDMNVDLDLAVFRSYDAAMARWLHVDPLADNAPSLTAYRMGFNNPVRFTDALGLFESEKEAKKYAKANGIRTGWFSRSKIVEQSDGTFAIENRKQGSFITSFTDADCHTQVIKGALYVGKGVHLSEIGWEAYSQLNNPLSEHYNPHAVVFTGGSDILYAAGSLLGFASPAGRMANLGRAASAAGDAAPAYETVYRTMSSTSAEVFMQTGRMPAGSETFVSTSETFAKNFSGVFFEINLKQGTLNQLQGIGVRNLATAHPYPNMPLVGKGWKNSNAFFKVEGSTMNIGLGHGKALDFFNENIINFSPK